MKKLCYIFATLWLSQAAYSATIDIKKQGIPLAVQNLLSESHYEHNLDPYFNLCLKIHKLTPGLEQKILNIKNAMAQHASKQGFYVYVPVHLAKVGTTLKKLGFVLYNFDPKKDELIYLFRNQRAIPDISNAFTTASVFVVRTNPKTCEKEILVVDESEKQDLTVPAGYSDDQELGIDTAIRETKEETNIILDRKKIKLISIRNRTYSQTNRNHVDMCFMAEVPFNTQAKVDGKEVSRAAWVPIKKLTQPDFKLFGKKLSILYVNVLENKMPTGVVHPISDTHSITKVASID